MSERSTSFLILSGGVLLVLALWYLSVVVVRRDTRRRGVPELARKAWIAAAVVLPLFGFALYLFVHILRGYLAPSAEPVERHPTEVKMPATGGRAAVYDTDPRQTPATVPAAYQRLAGSFLLLATNGPHAGQQFPLNPLPARIGRGPENRIALDEDLNVSRSHAEIYEWNGSLHIRDFGSTHGTQVNGIPVTDRPIRPGDRISIGGTTFILRNLLPLKGEHV